LDITSVAVLSMFGAAFAGGIVGFAIGKLTRFETGLMVGLFIFGGVTLAFSLKCYMDYQDFAHAGSDGLWGEVIEIIDKPSNESGSITSPAPIVRFTGPDERVYTIEGPTASGAKVGAHVNVIFDRDQPERSRVGQIGELRGAAIAMMLFGTFPTSFALMILLNMIHHAATTPDRPSATRTGRSRREVAAAATKTKPAVRGKVRGRRATIFLALGMLCSLLWITLEGESLVRRFAQGFSGMTATLLAYALWSGFIARLGFETALGVFTLALNFGVWAFALFLLS